MVSVLIQYFTFIVANVSAWMHKIFEETGGIYIYLGALACFLFIRLLLRPFLGRRMGSDFSRGGNYTDYHY